jgi:hypothetical protein
VVACYPLLSPIPFSNLFEPSRKKRIKSKKAARVERNFVWNHWTARSNARYRFKHAPYAFLRYGRRGPRRVLCRRRQRYKHASVVERPPQSPTRQRCIAARASVPLYRYIYSAPLYICRVALFLLRQLALASCNEHVAKENIAKYFATTPAHTKRSLYGSQSSRGRISKTT